MTTLLTIGLTNAVTATVLAIVVWCLTRVWRQPAVSQLLWVLVLVKLVTPPLITIPWTFERSTQTLSVPLVTETAIKQHDLRIADETAMPTFKPQRTRTVNEQVSVPVVRQLDSTSSAPIHWEAIALAVWIAGSASWLLTAAARLARFHHALRNTMECSADIKQMADKIAAKLSVTSRFRLRITEARLSPLVWPIGRPTILLSRPLIAELSTEEIETLLAHELAHLKRKDHWLRWFELLATTFYWWHPVLWWARRMIHKAEEQACDAWVVFAFPGAAKLYASALFTVMQMISDQRAAAPLVASQLGSTGNLKQRIEDIMNMTWTCSVSNSARFALVLLGLSIVPFSLRFAAAADEPSPNVKAKPATAREQNAAAPPSTTEKAATSNPTSVTSNDRTLGAQPDRASSPEELAALREHVKFLDDRFKSIDSLYKTGSRGGSADARARTGFELATAQAELAAAEGRRDQAIVYSEQAAKFADEAMKAVIASYESGRLALDTLLTTAKDVSESKRRLARLREPQSTTTAQQKPVSENGADPKRDVAPRGVTSNSNTSASVSKMMMQRTLQKLERMKRLAELKVVPAEEVEAAKTDYDISVAQYAHALRNLKYAQLEVELAETELQEAASRPRTTGNSTDDFELKKLKIKVEMAKVKVSEVE